MPKNNPNFQGHMLWDTTLAANIGYIAALFYNQNNVASMASGVTLQLEREVGHISTARTMWPAWPVASLYN